MYDAIFTVALRSHKPKVSQCWFMFLPPTMSMLDDPEPFFKVRGVRLARMLIDTLDSKLINQAGLRTLWESVSFAFSSSVPSDTLTSRFLLPLHFSHKITARNCLSAL